MITFKDHILLEKTDYMAGFAKLLKIRPDASHLIRREIRWAEEVLKKEHRIIWFLRWWKILYVDDNQHKFSKDFYKNIIKDYNKKTKGTKLTSLGLGVTTHYLKEQLQHFMDMNLNKIDRHKFRWETITELFVLFVGYETEWRETLEHKLLSEKKTFLKIDKTFTWFDLEASFSEEERQAMGHCGNAGSGTLISLRAKKPEGWESHVTVAFEPSTGHISQMKGKGNTKPVDKYHKYIVPFLLDKRIKSMTAYSADFQVDDLSDRHQELVVQEKPGLKYSVFLEIDNKTIWFWDKITTRYVLRKRMGNKWKKIMHFFRVPSNKNFEGVEYYDDPDKYVNEIIAFLRRDGGQMGLTDLVYKQLPKRVRLYIDNNDPALIEDIYFDVDNNYKWFELNKEEFGKKGYDYPFEKTFNNYIILKKKVKDKMMFYWEPLLVATVDTGSYADGDKIGTIYDMGIGTPDKKYHKMIMQLLRFGRVHSYEGIPGKGFDIDDLMKVTKLNLIRDKPSLWDVSVMISRLYNNFNDDDFALLMALDYNPFKYERGNVIIESYDSVYEWIDKYVPEFNGKAKDRHYTSSQKFIEEGFDNWDFSYSYSNFDMNNNYYFEKTDYPDIIEKIMNKKYPDWEDEYDTLNDAVKGLEEEIYGEITNAYVNAEREGSEEEAYKALQKTVESADIKFLPDFDGKLWEAIEWIMDPKDFVNELYEYRDDIERQGMDDIFHPDYYDMDVSFDEPRNGWEGFSEEHFKEEMKEIIRGFSAKI